ncbi:hypothetical protein GC105_11555 [Alkalibaculum sp. M08DMB]|uniref:Uncharacterized protein n=1 Tax=Alkalibaculum sporogenes TaxID=2655001 RepID=A0A6A7KAP3_9FIRM|nr:hypothetical protein [Alkalibaculum sporogenes]MPW26425.1 hypothetical protein [Alkalibaculum sporogenes]
MALYRKIETSFWCDVDMQDLTPEEKYFYLYLMTNDYTNLLGIYQITIRNIAHETGYNQDTVKKLIHKFIEYGKVLYSFENSELMILNWFKHNSSNSPKAKAAIKKDLEEVKTFEFTESFISICNKKSEYLDRVFIEYLYSISSISISNSSSISKKTYVCDLPENQIQNVCKEVPAENLGESEPRGADPDHSKNEDRKDNKYIEEFEKIWIIYPRRKEKAKARKAFIARVKQKHDPEIMLKAAINYARYCRAQKLEERYIKHLATFFGPDEPYIDYINYSPPNNPIPPSGGGRAIQKISNDHNDYDYDDIEAKLLRNSLGSDFHASAN